MIRQDYKQEISRLNDSIFEEEARLEECRNAVVATRHYLSADPDNDERLNDLFVKISVMKAQQTVVDGMRERLETMVSNIFSHMED